MMTAKEVQEAILGAVEAERRRCASICEDVARRAFRKNLTAKFTPAEWVAGAATRCAVLIKREKRIGSFR